MGADAFNQESISNSVTLMKNSVDNKLKVDTSIENSAQILGDLDKFINIVDTVNNSNWESTSSTL